MATLPYKIGQNFFVIQYLNRNMLSSPHDFLTVQNRAVAPGRDDLDPTHKKSGSDKYVIFEINENNDNYIA